jgi:hypothetical protein
MPCNSPATCTCYISCTDYTIVIPWGNFACNCLDKLARKAMVLDHALVRFFGFPRFGFPRCCFYVLRPVARKVDLKPVIAFRFHASKHRCRVQHWALSCHPASEHHEHPLKLVRAHSSNSVETLWHRVSVYSIVSYLHSSSFLWKVQCPAASLQIERRSTSYRPLRMIRVDLSSIKEAFNDFDCPDDAVWDSAVGLAQQLQITPGELSEKYEVFAINKCGYAQSRIHMPVSIFFDRLCPRCLVRGGNQLWLLRIAKHDLQEEVGWANHHVALQHVCRGAKERKIQGRGCRESCCEPAFLVTVCSNMLPPCGL